MSQITLDFAIPNVYYVYMEAKTIKQIRTGLKESQTVFATRFGYTRDAIAKWESGERRPIGLSVGYLKRLHKRLGL